MDNLTEEERRLKVKPENAPDKAESIRRFAMSVRINGLQNKVQKDVAYNHLLAYAAMVERCEKLKQDVLKIGDPWVGPRTRLWDDGTYDGDGKDLIACRDIVHDLYELFEKGDTDGTH